MHAYSEFVAEYKRVAKDLDLPRNAVPPTRSQYYRWVGDQVRTLPQGHHCVVLERMFPGWRVQELFVDVLRGLKAVDSSCHAGCLVAHRGNAVGRLVVDVRAERLCRFAALRALMRATDLRVGGCLQPRRFDTAGAGSRHPSTS